VKFLSFETALTVIKEQPPDLVIIDPEGEPERGLALVGALGTPSLLPSHVSLIYLADAFDEDTFLTCYDAGARDFLVKPVNSAYLISRIILALDEVRLREKLTQRDAILKELAVLGPDSNVFTTEYLMKTLKREYEKTHPGGNIAMILLQLEGLESSAAAPPGLKQKIYRHLADTLKRCCRGSDTIGEFFEDKFALILPETGIAGAQTVIDRIRQHISGANICFDRPPSTCTLSIFMGMADNTECRNYEDLMSKANDALRSARIGNQKILFAV
jgi:PleD family two-component response regulator